MLDPYAADEGAEFRRLKAYRVPALLAPKKPEPKKADANKKKSKAADSDIVCGFDQFCNEAFRLLPVIACIIFVE